jgi:hypothetical protein
MTEPPRPGLRESEPLPCTCHPDDNPPVPCAQKYALSQCLLTEPQARATADAELLAEAVRLLEPFGRLSDRLPNEGVLVEVCRPHPDNPSPRIEPFLTKHLRAAAAFLLTLTQDAGGERG